MKDVAGLMHLAFKLAHEISDAGLDMERQPGLRQHRFYADRMADAGVSALAHVAAASVGYASDFRGRMEAATSIREARACLGRMKNVLKTVRLQRYVDEAKGEVLAAKLDELEVILMALAVEVRGNRLVA